MPDSKITALTSIGTSTDPANDPLVLVDVSDTSMAASGTTKKVTLNQLLGASGTATLASATISGDLTVDTSTLKVDSANDRVGVGTATPATRFHVALAAATYGEVARFYDASGNGISLTANASSGFNQLTSTGAQPLIFNVNSGERYRIGSDGTATWSVGGSTAMTLNATGLGVGGSPQSKISCAGNSSSNQVADITIVRSSSGTAIQTGPNIVFADGTTNNTIAVQNTQGRFGIWNYGAGAWNERLSIDSSGNVGVGVTPSAWNSNYNAFDIGQNGTIAGRAGSSNTVDIASNGFRNTSGNWVYKLATSNTACRYQIDGSTGSHIWYTGAAGTAGNTISGFSSALMTLDASGNLIWSPASSPPSLATNGQLTVNATSNTNLRFSYRGSDGVTRVANLTLA